MDYSWLDFSNEEGWVSEQTIDIDKANDTATKVVEAQGYITMGQVIDCLCGRSFDDVIDYDVRIWKPKTVTKAEWLYPL